jgi:phosphatidylglycerol:prolipoprotein diacylglycerol transferase
MHPILFEIPLNYVTIAVMGLVFAIGGVIRTRFVQADKDASYLATFLGLNVYWGQVAAPWDKAITQGALNGGFAAVITYAVKYVAETRFQTTTIPLHIYGLMMATAFIVGIWAAMREAKHQQMPAVPYLDKNGKQYKDKNGNPVFLTAADLMSDLAFYLLLAGLGGSRILYIMTRWDTDYAPDPKRIFMFWQGGLVWYGGLIGATLVTVWFIRKHKVAFLPYGDAIVPGVSIAHAIGRLGCFAAGCCFGNVANPHFPFAVQFPAGSPASVEHWGEYEGMHELSKAVYPTQIMESLGEVFIFFILLRVRTRKRFHGQVLLTYFFLYAILRTVMEMFRGDSIRGFFFRWPNAEHPMLLSTSQGVSILMAVVGIVLTVALVRQRNRLAAMHAVEPRAA